MLRKCIILETLRLSYEGNKWIKDIMYMPVCYNHYFNVYYIKNPWWCRMNKKEKEVKNMVDDGVRINVVRCSRCGFAIGSCICNKR